MATKQVGQPKGTLLCDKIKTSETVCCQIINSVRATKKMPKITGFISGDPKKK